MEKEKDALHGGYIKEVTEGMVLSAQDQAISRNYFKWKILKEDYK
jgi:hypothetical protein